MRKTLVEGQRIVAISFKVYIVLGWFGGYLEQGYSIGL